MLVNEFNLVWKGLIHSAIISRKKYTLVPIIKKLKNILLYFDYYQLTIFY